jgi:hypothetical protein
MHLGEIIILKIKMQMLENKNKILIFTCSLTSNTYIDLVM